MFAALADSLGFGEEFLEGRTADAWVRHLWDETRAKRYEQGHELPEFEQVWQASRLGLPADLAAANVFQNLSEDPDRISTPTEKLRYFQRRLTGSDIQTALGARSGCSRQNG